MEKNKQHQVVPTTKQRLFEVLRKYECERRLTKIEKIANRWLYKNRILNLGEAPRFLKDKASSLSERSIADSAYNTQKRFIKYRTALECLLQFEDLIPSEGETIFSPPILEAKKLLEKTEADCQAWIQYVKNYEEAKKKQPKKEKSTRPLQIREPIRQLAFELCQLFNSIFPPKEKAYQDGYGNEIKAVISERACSVSSEIIKALLFHQGILYLKTSKKGLVKDESIKAPTTDQVKRLYHQRLQKK